MDKPKKLKKRVIKALRFFKVNILDNPLWFIIFIVVISLGLCYSITLLNYSITNDEGGYSFMAKKILDGAIPYKDYFDHKPPGVYYAFALAFLLFGKSLFTARMLVFAVNVCTAVTIFFVGRALKKPAVGQLASVLFLFAALTPVYIGYLALTEPFVMLFSTLSILLYIRSDDGDKTKMVLLSGVALGLATLFKQSAFPIIVAFIAYFLLGFRLKENRAFGYLKRKVKDTLWLVTGVGLVWLPFVIFFYSKGALGDMIYCVFVYNEEYLSYSHITSATGGLIWDKFMLYSYIFIFGIISMVLIIYKYILMKKYDYYILFILVFASLMSQVVFYQLTQYFLTFLPVLSILAALTTVHIIRYLKSPPKAIIPAKMSVDKRDVVHTVKLLLIFFTVSLLVSSYYTISASYPHPRAGGRSALDNYIIAHTAPDEKIFIFGPSPFYYFTMERDPPCKYFFLYGTATEDMQRTIIEGLEKYQVKYVVVLKYALNSNGYPRSAVTLYDYIMTHYTYNCTVNPGYIYTRSV